MKSLLAVLAAAVCFAAVGVSASSASTPTVIGYFGCTNFFGGSETVPAGTTVVLRAGWIVSTPGLAVDFVHDVTTTAALNDTPIANPDSLWTAPVFLNPYWQTSQYYSLGTLGAGQSATLALQWTVSHSIWDGISLNPDGTHAVIPAGTEFVNSSCTITGE